MLMYVIKDVDQESFSNINAISVISNIDVLVRELGNFLTSPQGMESWYLKFPDKMGIYQVGDIDDAGTVIGGETMLIMTIKDLVEKFKETYKERYNANVEEIKKSKESLKK